MARYKNGDILLYKSLNVLGFITKVYPPQGDIQLYDITVNQPSNYLVDEDDLQEDSK